MEPLLAILPFSVNDPLPHLINLSRNTLRRKDKVHIEAYNLYFQVRNFGNLYQ